MSRKHRTEEERKAAQARYDAMIAAEDARLRAEVERHRLEAEKRTPEERAAACAEAVRIFNRGK